MDELIEVIEFEGRPVAWRLASGRLMPFIAGGADDDDDEDDHDDDSNDDDDLDTTDDVEKLRAEVKKWQAMSRKTEAAAKKNAAAAKELEEIKASQQTEAERTAAAAAAAESRAATAERDAMRMRVAIRKGLPEDLMLRLQGESEEDLEADAEKLLEYVPRNDADAEDSGLPRRPQERLRPGARPTAQPTVTDPEKLAAAIPRGGI